MPARGERRLGLTASSTWRSSDRTGKEENIGRGVKKDGSGGMLLAKAVPARGCQFLIYSARPFASRPGAHSHSDRFFIADKASKRATRWTGLSLSLSLSLSLNSSSPRKIVHFAVVLHAYRHEGTPTQIQEVVQYSNCMKFIQSLLTRPEHK